MPLKDELAVFLAASIADPGTLATIMDAQESDSSKEATEEMKDAMTDLLFETEEVNILDSIDEDEWAGLT